MMAEEEETGNQMKDIWKRLKEGQKVLLSWNEGAHELPEFIKTLPEADQDLYYRKFASKARGINAALECWIKK